MAECAIALMWEGARGLAKMDRGIRAGNWLRDDGMQLTGKTLGLIGFGGIAAEVARIALGSGMRVIAWNRTPKKHPKVEFVELDDLLAESDVISMHLLLNDETRGFVSRACIEAMKPGVIFVNTARGAIVDEQAMIDALQIRPHPPCRARRLQHRAAAGGSSADQARQRDAVGAFRVPHAGSEREFDARGVGALPADCEGKIDLPFRRPLRQQRTASVKPQAIRAEHSRSSSESVMPKSTIAAAYVSHSLEARTKLQKQLD